MWKRRIAVSRGYFSSVSRMKGLYGSSLDAGTRVAMTPSDFTPPLASKPSARSTASWCTPSCAAMVPTFQCSAKCSRRMFATTSIGRVIAHLFHHRLVLGRHFASVWCRKKRLVLVHHAQRYVHVPSSFASPCSLAAPRVFAAGMAVVSDAGATVAAGGLASGV